MLKTKNCLALGLVLLLVLGILAGCGGPSEPVDLDEEENGVEENGGEELVLLEEGVLKAAFNADFPPFEMRDENDVLCGFDYDLMNELGKIMGYEVHFDDVPFDGIFAGLGTAYDVVISGVTINDERLLTMDFSDPYFDAGQVIVVRKGYDGIAGEEDLPGKKLGVQIGTTGQDVLTDMEEIADDDILVYDNYPLAFIDLVNGGSDAVVCDVPVAKTEAKRNDKVELVSEEPFTVEFYGIAVAKGNSKMVEELNAALAQVKESGVYDELLVKWFVEYEGEE
ncbi:MAG: basic amino acid ABC transporter substrate-binding protein [Firmicutes bacterium]|nr:basic amino acid ABC transporter substrate-binding protein [Bacillota bacterium]